MGCSNPDYPDKIMITMILNREEDFLIMTLLALSTQKNVEVSDKESNLVPLHIYPDTLAVDRRTTSVPSASRKLSDRRFGFMACGLSTNRSIMLIIP